MIPVLGKDHAQNNDLEHDDDSTKNHRARGDMKRYQNSNAATPPFGYEGAVQRRRLGHPER
jgi:hypothetical protein